MNCGQTAENDEIVNTSPIEANESLEATVIERALLKE
jgi:hypothetical protein